jgi:hypothetical protein
MRAPDHHPGQQNDCQNDGGQLLHRHGAPPRLHAVLFLIIRRDRPLCCACAGQLPGDAELLISRSDLKLRRAFFRHNMATQSHGAATQESAAKVDHEERARQCDEAARWCLQHGKGSRAATSEPQNARWPLAKRSTVEDRLRSMRMGAQNLMQQIEEASPNTAKMLAQSTEFVNRKAVMTDEEELQLVALIRESARDPKKKGIDYPRFRAEVRHVLWIRQVQTTKTQGKARPIDVEGTGKPVPYNEHAIPLSHNALLVLANPSAPSKEFKDAFYARHALHINEGTAYQNDVARAAKLTYTRALEHLEKLYIELTTLPLPLYEEDGVTQQKDANGVKLTISCPEWQAIFNPRTHRFQSGDRNFYAKIERWTKERDDVAVELKRLEGLLQTLDLASARYQSEKKDLEAQVKDRTAQLARKEEWLADALSEDERRGRARFFNDDEMPQMLNFDGGLGSHRSRVGKAPGTVSCGPRRPLRSLVQHGRAGLDDGTHGCGSESRECQGPLALVSATAG